MKTRKLFLTGPIVMALAATAATALAAPGDGYNAPELEAPIPWWAILYAVVALAGVAVVAFKNARRTHLD